MDKYIEEVVKQIISVVNVNKIILFSKKQNPNGQISSFKLCVIISENDTSRYEKEIYIKVDSDVPFDVLVFSENEWEKYKCRKDSFCSRINTVGSVVYE